MSVVQVREFENPAEYMAWLRAKAAPATPVVPRALVNPTFFPPAPLLPSEPPRPVAPIDIPGSFPWQARKVYPPSDVADLVERLAAYRTRSRTSSASPPVDLRLYSINGLVELVASVTLVVRADLLSNRRHKPAVKARQICMWLCKRFTAAPCTEMGRRLGGRDHTTVLSGIKKMEKLAIQVGPPEEELPEAWARHLWRHVWETTSIPRPQSLSSGDPA